MRRMRIAIVTDAWHPQVNGVVTTLAQTAATLETFGHEVRVFSPEGFKTFPCPTYPEIRLAWRAGPKLASMLDTFSPDRIHVATEGPLGLAGRNYCKRRGLNFTTSYHTQFPQYLRKRAPIPLTLSYAFLRWFHGAATHTMVATDHQQKDLEDNGFTNIVRWTRGVDTELFRPGDPEFLPGERPVWIYVGRVAVEKTLEKYLELDLPGTKYVVGDGPARAELEQQFPDAVFTGYKFGEELAAHMGAANVFVFPSLTDTFGIVMLDAMASGLPVAAFPVTGPIDVVEDGITGVLSEDLRAAAMAALKLDPAACRRAAEQSSWPNATRQFFANTVPARSEVAAQPA